MALGTLESIEQSLGIIAKHLSDGGAIAGQSTPANTKAATPETDDETDDEPKATSKKAASKKTASKKTASRKGKALDLSDITVFKKQLFDIAENSGVDDVMPKLKKYIKSCEYGSSDEIEVADRAAFLKDVKAHFAAMGEDDDETGELDDL